MKAIKNTLALALVLLSITAFAQAPQGMQYQTVARDANGDALANTSVGIQVTIRQGSATGTDVYQEIHGATTNQFGLVSLAIGNGTTQLGVFDTIDWSAGSYFLNVGLDPSGGNSFTDMGTTQLLSVPYALYAESAGTGGPTGPTGADGPAGPTGPTGPTGSNATIYAGSGISIVNDTIINTSASGAWAPISRGIAYAGDSVAVGFTNPWSKFHVTDADPTTDGSSGAFISVNNSEFTTGTTCGIRFGTTNNLSKSAIIHQDNGSNGIGDMHFALTTNTGANESDNVNLSHTVMTVANTGYVGIGKMAPEADLHIKQSAGGFTTPNGGGLTLEESGGSSKWTLWNSNDFLSIAYNGNRVAYFDNGTGTLVSTSDRQVKENINYLPQGTLEKVMQLKPATYTYKHAEDKRTLAYGFIAQEVGEVMPELVRGEKDGHLKALAYSDFGVLAIKAIQEQQELIKMQQAQIDAMQKEIDALKQ